MRIVIGSARSDERGQYSGGKRGDQRQAKAPDYTGEVSLQNFYLHRKGWRILRPKYAHVAAGIAAAAQRACDNKNVGYSQSDRYAILVDGTASAEPTSADCSSLVRQCIKEAAGVDPGDFTTANEASALEATGQFEPARDYSAGVELYTGDVLVTKTKGHTVVVTEGKQRSVKFGWEKDGVVWRYYEVDGLPVKNDWRCIGTTSGKHWYWFNALGVMATGWQFIDGKWYYLDEDYGAWSEGACWRSDASGAQSVWTVE